MRPKNDEVILSSFEERKRDCLSKIFVSLKLTKMGDRQSHADLKPFLAKRIDRLTSVTASVRERGQIEVTLLTRRSRMAQNLDRVVFIRELEQ